MNEFEDRPHSHVCVQCTRCGLWGTHTYKCAYTRKPPERGHKASTWRTPAPCQEPTTLSMHFEGDAMPTEEQRSAQLQAENDRLRQALQDLADEYDRLADRAHAAHVAVLEIPYIAARDALGQTSDGSRLNG